VGGQALWSCWQAREKRWVSGWAERLPPADTPPPVAEPRTWLARRGWRRYGPIRLDEGPAERAAAAENLPRRRGGRIVGAWSSRSTWPASAATRRIGGTTTRKRAPISSPPPPRTIGEARPALPGEGRRRSRSPLKTRMSRRSFEPELAQALEERRVGDAER